ncbi:MAG TPA: methyltransferase domain-containing protein [Verrucomicrobiota bacterium]|nr:methyltransferase domain-containing protein [Verrucomicrobiota bacterium]HNU50123.1 methyltransferase domain-containing protein [Verrucomicrobiota bacterium]
MRGDEFFSTIARRPPFTKLAPRVAAFFKDYFAREKVIAFGDRHVVNTHFPPYPSRAFDRLVGQFGQLGDAGTRRLYSVTLAVTNRCPFHCWHCYNAGRSTKDLPLETLERLASDLQARGAVMVTLTGGEPLLREDLADLAGAFGPESCLIVGTTGEGLTPDRAIALKRRGVFAVGISLDSDLEVEHDRLRGRRGAFRTALDALAAARNAGLYPYVVSVATREFLSRDRFLAFLRFAQGAGALEVHLLEPSATGRLAGRTDVLLTASERRLLLDYQAVVAQDETLPILSCFAYLESAEAFGCGAGLTHLYIDGSGEVCPCNLVPLSFGNVGREPLDAILARMGRCFCRPRPGCVGTLLAGRLPAAALPLSPAQSIDFCERHLPRVHDLPRFFQLRDGARGAEVGMAELRTAYDHVHEDYDAFWLVSAADPVDRLIGGLSWTGRERVFEAGCGTGYATAQLAARAAEVLAVDLSEGMLARAWERLGAAGCTNVRFRCGDALEALGEGGGFDRVFSSWVLGYIPLAPFFEAARKALVPDGRVAFVVHKENSPREPLEIFGELVAADPAILLKRVAFDFPRDADQIRALAAATGFEIETIGEGQIVFVYATAQGVLDHLLKSGAGTAFHDAIDPARREALTGRFLDVLTRRNRGRSGFEVRHDYVACVMKRAGLPSTKSAAPSR